MVRSQAGSENEATDSSRLPDSPHCACARVEQLSWTPRAYVYHNFLSPMECEHVVKISRPLVRQLCSCDMRLQHGIGPPVTMRVAEALNMVL